MEHQDVSGFPCCGHLEKGGVQVEITLAVDLVTCIANVVYNNVNMACHLILEVSLNCNGTFWRMPVSKLTLFSWNFSSREVIRFLVSGLSTSLPFIKLLDGRKLECN